MGERRIGERSMDCELKMRELFDVSFGKIRSFRKKSYEATFHGLYETFQSFFQELAEEVQEESEIEKVAGYIPQYVKEKLKSVSKRKREILGIDYNLCMAVYVIPLLKYSNTEEIKRVASKMVTLWNEMEMIPLTLKESSFEEILGGFKKGFCYITTAVCAAKNLPDDCEELEILRNYRDTYLMTTVEGEALVHQYYEWAPALIQGIESSGTSEKVYEAIYKETILLCIEMIQKGEWEACKQVYKTMVESMMLRFGGSMGKKYKGDV